MSAAASGTAVRSFFVTLKRSYAGTPYFHQRILTALGLKRRHLCVEKPNNRAIRGMLYKVPHLVIVETDKMFYLRRMKEYYQQLCRAPVVTQHDPAALALSAHAVPMQFTRFVQRQHTEHVLPANMEGFDKLFVQQPPRRYFLEQAQKRKVAELNKHGLYSQKAKELHEEAMTVKQYGARRFGARSA